MKVIKKEVQVHMLPTEEASQIHYVASDSTNYSQGLNFIDIPKNSSNHTKSKPQHLYFTSDENIKEEDWVLLDYPTGYKIKKMVDNSSFENVKFIKSEIKYHNRKHRKIIASTDPKLTSLQPKSILFQDFLPQPSNSFIKDYCEQGGIDKVLVEYQIIKASNRGTQWGIKVNPMDNTITIHKNEEKTYTESEVDKLRKDAFNLGVNVGQNSCKRVLKFLRN